MATGAPGTNGVWQYGEDDSEATFSALLNKAASTTDTQLGLDRTRLTALEARSLAGMVLVSATAVGAGVSTVTISSAFSSTYENYRIIYSGGTSSTDNYLNLKLGSTATGYYGSLYGINYNNNTMTTAANNNATSWYFCGSGTNSYAMLDATLLAPQLAKKTMVSSYQVGNTAGRNYTGYLNDTTAYTAFTITADTGTFSGGTIYVYGMKK